MRIQLAYGKTGLVLQLPAAWNVTVVEPRYVSGVTEPHLALQTALRSPYNSLPLKDFVKPRDRVGIIFSDITRPTPHKLILPAVLDELAHVPSAQITLFNACGTHRFNTETELRDMLGADLFSLYPIEQNAASDPSTQISLGRSSQGNEIWINRNLANCDVKILTGVIEPHLFAGFSGGGKAIMPGMCGLRTILNNHATHNIRHPQATWGVTRGNPIWEEVREVAHLAGRTFLVNVSLNKHKNITGVFAGELDAAHTAGCAFVRKTAMTRVPGEFDIVVTTNSGYPLDLNLYQSVKGMSAAAQIIRPGGAIIVAADCWDGIPDHGLYGRLLRESNSPQELLERIQRPDFLEQDQWQAQIQALIQIKADVYLHTDNLSDKQIRSAKLRPCHSIETTIADLLNIYGPGSKICVLPEGPQTIPYIQQ